MNTPVRPPVVRWLQGCALLVVAVLIVGGLTRLLHAGLSITRWDPLIGTLPPLTEADWQSMFGRYQASPEFRWRNPDMDLAQFRGIFWWEYVHRLLARGLGLAFAVPLWVFWRRGWISLSLRWRLVGILALGGLQGALGWYMVSSGLIDDPHVSPLRLAAHLGLALVVLAALLWTSLQAQDPPDGPGARPLWALCLPFLVFVMMLLGALSAGTQAGLAYPTFPQMNGDWIPPDLWRFSPWFDNLWRNPATVQFLHRVTGAVLLLVLPVIAWGLVWQRRIGLRTAALPVAVLVVQICLGAATVRSGVPPALASAHQAVAVLLWMSSLWMVFRSRQA